MTEPASKIKARKTDFQKLSYRDRCNKALELYLAGNTCREIGLELGCSDATAHRYYRAALKELQDKVNIQAHAKKHLIIDLMRCEQLIKALWPNRHYPRNAEVIMRLMERKAKMLGYDAPVRTMSLNMNTDLNELSYDELRQEVERLGYTKTLETPIALPGEELSLPSPKEIIDVELQSGLPTESEPVSTNSPGQPS